MEWLGMHLLNDVGFQIYGVLMSNCTVTTADTLRKKNMKVSIYDLT